MVCILQKQCFASFALPLCLASEVLVPRPLLQSQAGDLPTLRGEPRRHGWLLRLDLRGGDPAPRPVDPAGAGGAALGGQRRAAFQRVGPTAGPHEVAPGPCNGVEI